MTGSFHGGLDCAHWALLNYLHVNFLKLTISMAPWAKYIFNMRTLMVFKTAAKNHNATWMAQLTKVMGFVERMLFWDILWKDCHVTQFIRQLSDVFIKKLLGDSLRFQERDEETQLECVRHVQNADCRCSQMHKVLSGYQGYTLDSGSVVFLHTSTKKGMKNKS